jgi:hypothetical protein
LYLEQVFTNFKISIQRCKTELIKEIIKLGGIPDEDSGDKGYFKTVSFNFKIHYL